MHMKFIKDMPLRITYKNKEIRKKIIQQQGDVSTI